MATVARNVLAIVLPYLVGSALGRSIAVDDPGEGNTLHYFQKVPNVLGYLNEWDGTSDMPMIVNSEIPVSILRYAAGQYLVGQEPLGPDDMYVVVKSNCPSSDIQPVVEFGELSTGFTGSIDISLTPESDANYTINEEASFLEPSSFFALWNYTGYWCASLQADRPQQKDANLLDENGTPTENSNPQATSTESNDATSSHPSTSSILATLLGGALTFAILWDRNHARQVDVQFIFVVAITLAIVTIVQADMFSDNPHTETRSDLLFGSRELEDQQCTVNVEILLDGCRRSTLSNLVDLEVTAPAVRVLDVIFNETSNSVDPNNNCTTDYEGLMTFPDLKEPLPEANLTVPVSSINPNDSLQCQPRPVEGRPYVDARGKRVQATIDDSNQESGWSVAPATAVDVLVDGDHDEALGRDWADRALGEHASISSFAAFTIALMSNNAPPDLIRDALFAALDEVRHAKTSFEIASLLLGTSVNPGAMPATHHQFGQDLSSLAVAAAQEGCIDETLSALIAAHEVDLGIDNLEQIGDDTKSFLKDKTRTIALEETRHAALAWRTVKWACTVDEAACEVVKHEVFDPSNLERSFMIRFGDLTSLDGAREAWEEIHKSLVPLVTAQRDGAGPDLQFGCVQNGVSPELESALLLEQMAKRIINEAVCPSSYDTQSQS